MYSYHKKIPLHSEKDNLQVLINSSLQNKYQLEVKTF